MSKPETKRVPVATRMIPVADTAEYVDTICEGIHEGLSLTQIAALLGRSKSGLLDWISARPERMARVRSARAAAAVFWDEEAERVLLEAPETVAGVAKAKEIAQHYRWRASKTAPTEYGDKLQVEAKLDVASRMLELERKGLLPPAEGSAT